MIARKGTAKLSVGWRPMAEEVGCHYMTIKKHVEKVAAVGWVGIGERTKQDMLDNAPLVLDFSRCLHYWGVNTTDQSSGNSVIGTNRRGYYQHNRADDIFLRAHWRYRDKWREKHAGEGQKPLGAPGLFLVSKMQASDGAGTIDDWCAETGWRQAKVKRELDRLDEIELLEYSGEACTLREDFDDVLEGMREQFHSHDVGDKRVLQHAQDQLLNARTHSDQADEDQARRVARLENRFNLLHANVYPDSPHKNPAQYIRSYHRPWRYTKADRSEKAREHKAIIVVMQKMRDQGIRDKDEMRRRLCYAGFTDAEFWATLSHVGQSYEAYDHASAPI